MKILFFDTETTGLYRFDLPPNDDSQPRLVQLGATLVDGESGRSLYTIGTMIIPSGFTIPENMVHGISNEMAASNGAPVHTAMGLFTFLLHKCDLLVAHNIKFDINVVTSEASRLGVVLPERPMFCTMLESTEICRIKKTRGSGYKWPKLSEAYQFFFNEELKNAHDALTDVMACKRIYFEVFNKKEKQ